MQSYYRAKKELSSVGISTDTRPDPTLDTAREDFAVALSEALYSLIGDRYGPLTLDLSKEFFLEILRKLEERSAKTTRECTLLAEEFVERVCERGVG